MPKEEGKATVCQECGMLVFGGEYHPYAACLMFKGCNNAVTVRSNLIYLEHHYLQQADKRKGKE